MSIEQGYPGKTNYGGEPVPRDRVDDSVIDDDTTAVEPELNAVDRLPQPRTSEDYIIPHEEEEKKGFMSRRGAFAAIGAAAVVGAVAAGVLIFGRDGNAPKDAETLPNPNAPSATGAPFETNTSQAITSETTTVKVETTIPETPNILPLSLDGYVFLGEKAYTEAEAKSHLTIKGADPKTASAKLRELMGGLMSGGTNPNYLAHTAGNDPAKAKAHLETQVNSGTLSSFVEGDMSVDGKTALTFDSNLTLGDLVVGHHNKNIDANKVGDNIYSGGNISEVSLASEEAISPMDGYVVVKAKWAVTDFDRSGQNSTKGQVVDVDSYTVSAHLRPGPNGTWTVADFAATKAPNNK